eukprot:scaffold279218_cov30-Tisochrysis_lutea.AAC.4
MPWDGYHLSVLHLHVAATVRLGYQFSHFGAERAVDYLHVGSQWAIEYLPARIRQLVFPHTPRGMCIGLRDISAMGSRLHRYKPFITTVAWLQLEQIAIFRLHTQ